MPVSETSRERVVSPMQGVPKRGKGLGRPHKFHRETWSKKLSHTVVSGDPEPGK